MLGLIQKRKGRHWRGSSTLTYTQCSFREVILVALLIEDGSQLSLTLAQDEPTSSWASVKLFSHSCVHVHTQCTYIHTHTHVNIVT